MTPIGDEGPPNARSMGLARSARSTHPTEWDMAAVNPILLPSQRSTLSTRHWYSSGSAGKSLRNARLMLLGHSRARLSTVVFCSVLIAGTVFLGSYQGFGIPQRKTIPFSGGDSSASCSISCSSSLAMLLIFSAA